MKTTHPALLAAALTLSGCFAEKTPLESDLMDGATRRMPAEWEPQAAVWLQWPQPWEGAAVEASFVAIVEVVAQHEDVHLLATSARTRSRGEAALAGLERVTWHTIDNDSSWMRDNGPRYIEVDGQMVIQDWGFDAWGGGFGNIPYDADNAVPGVLAELLSLPMETVGLVHERGDLEVNGVDTALVSWSVISHRNPDLSRAEITARLEAALGVTSVIYTEGFDPQDGTRGHVDGFARFISEDTIVVGQDGSALLEDFAAQIASQRPDLNIVRMPVGAGDPYLNWLVGDGYVVTGTGSDDAAAREHIASYFPGRTVYFVDIEALWWNGGGVHCVTNDQPAVQ